MEKFKQTAVREIRITGKQGKRLKGRLQYYIKLIIVEGRHKDNKEDKVFLLVELRTAILKDS
jgi:hypothetical protein